MASLSTYASNKKTISPAEPTVANVDVATPSLAPSTETKTTQSKGGVQIAIDTDVYTAEVKPAYIDTPFQPGFKEIFHIGCTGPGTQLAYFIRDSKPQVALNHDHLVLHLHITNSLPRVFRGAGALIQFNIAGKTVHVNSNGYGDFLNAIIPPRSTQDIDIVGPELSIIPPQATIGVFIYDVVTKMDDAGNIREKQDFEWYYNWATQTTSKQVTLPAEQKVCIRQ
jgi:hypothetical protein